MKREAEVLEGNGMPLEEVLRQVGISGATYYGWGKEYGGLRLDQAKKLNELEVGPDEATEFSDDGCDGDVTMFMLIKPEEPVVDWESDRVRMQKPGGRISRRTRVVLDLRGEFLFLIGPSKPDYCYSTEVLRAETNMT